MRIYYVSPDSPCLDNCCQLDGSRSDASSAVQRKQFRELRKAIVSLFGEEALKNFQLLEDGSFTVRYAGELWNINPANASRRIRRYFTQFRSFAVLRIAQLVQEHFMSSHYGIVHPLTAQHIHCSDGWMISLDGSTITYSSLPTFELLKCDIDQLIELSCDRKKECRRQVFIGSGTNAIGHSFIELVILEKEFDAAVRIAVENCQDALIQPETGEIVRLFSKDRRAA